MSIPGLNLLNVALGAIASQPVTYERFLSRSVDAEGNYVNKYAMPVAARKGSLQPVPRTRYDVLGLEMSQDCYTWFVPRAVVGLERDSAGDMIRWQGKKMVLGVATEWSGADGWVQIICTVLKDKNA